VDVAAQLAAQQAQFQTMLAERDKRAAEERARAAELAQVKALRDQRPAASDPMEDLEKRLSVAARLAEKLGFKRGSAEARSLEDAAEDSADWTDFAHALADSKFGQAIGDRLGGKLFGMIAEVQQEMDAAKAQQLPPAPPPPALNAPDDPDSPTGQ
jgi:hypothetical protein